MLININGKRNITLDFNVPKKFRLTQDGIEIPYIRTGKNSFRLSKPVDGFVELEEIIEQPRYMQPIQLQPQQMTVINPQDVDRLNEAVRQMALVNPQDVMIINQTAEQLEKNQNFIAQTQKEIASNQTYIDQQQQRLNETALGIQALETDNSQRLDGAENAILNLAGEISNAQNMAVDGMNTALNKIEEQGIILQAEIDTKADKDELESLKKDFEEKSDRISSAMANYSGGTAYDTLPQGGEAGQILAKRTDRQGDYIWIDQTPVIVKSETIPTASAKYKGEVYQYVGETGEYTHGYIYECREIENNIITFTPSTISVSGSDFMHFLETASQGTDYNSVVKGTFTYSMISDLWRFVGKNSEDETVFTYQVYTGDYEELGFIMPENPQDGDVVNFVRETTISYAWVRLDVQPNHSSEIASLTTRVGNLETGKQDKLTQTQMDAVNSGITDDLVDEFKAKGALLDYANDVLSLEDSEGNVLSSVTINSASDVDNKSITLNTSDQLQTVGVIDSNNITNAIKTWTGTKAQYNAIVNKDANTEYFCSDTSELYLGTVKIGNADLNGKADVDLSNVSTTAKVASCGWAMPSNSKFDNLTVAASGNDYAMTSSGYLMVNGSSTSTSDTLVVVNNTTNMQVAARGGSGSYMRVFLPVQKGASVKLNYTSGVTINQLRFIYAVGSESEAS